MHHPITGLNQVAYETNETIFNLKTLPKHLIVVGGGPVGCELAQAFAMLSSKVTILEAFAILPKDDIDCVAILRIQLENMSIAIHDHIKVQGITQDEKGAVKVTIEANGKTQVIQGSHLLVSTGRRANVQGLDLEKALITYSSKALQALRAPHR